MSDTYNVTLGVRRGRNSYWKRYWRVITGKTTMLPGERKLKLCITLPANFFDVPVININVKLPADHGVSVTQDKA